MWEFDGIERTGSGLQSGLDQLRKVGPHEGASVRVAEESRQMTLLAGLMLGASLRREESRGAHSRSDFPATDDVHWKRRQVFRHA